jgi:two-component system sensor histidine kinase KdpD
MRRVDLRDLGTFAVVAVPSLTAATLLVAYLQDVLDVPNPSAIYLVPVVLAAVSSGTLAAVVTAIAGVLLYNYFYTDPRYTFAIADAGVWLSVLVLLFVGVVVGQLAARQRTLAEKARAREREARALFRISRVLAMRSSTLAALPELTEVLHAECDVSRVWLSLGDDDGRERTVWDSGGSKPPVLPASVSVLRRKPADEVADWVRVHEGRGSTPPAREAVYRAPLEDGGTRIGSLWALRGRPAGPPDRTATRLIAAAADQLAQSLALERLSTDAQAAEIARQSDAVKSALLQSVSHDLRTPLATIRAAAGALRPESAMSDENRHQSADAIDREVEYLNRVVTNLLDLSRIEAGVLRANVDVFELDDAIGPAIERIRPRLRTRTLEIDLNTAPVRVDPVLIDQAVTNILENALKYSEPTARICLGARPLNAAFVRLSIEDDGPGVPVAALPHLFDKFYRVADRSRGSRPGTGIGLAVARGVVEAMGGHIAARTSETGGLAIDLDLPAASVPASVLAGSAG